LGAKRALYALTDLTGVGSEEFVERAKRGTRDTSQGKKNKGDGGAI
jgi:hypothetical protein